MSHIDLIPQHAVPTPRRRRHVRAFGILVTLILFLPWLAFRAAVAWLPYPADANRLPPTGTWIEDRHGEPLAAFVSLDGQWHLPLADDQVSPHLLDAIVAVEDARFFDHAGVDWCAVAAAAWQNVSSLGVRRGASTLTMQLHRLRNPGPRTLFAKLEQAVRAAQIERTTDKRQILLEYVNRAPFGGNLVGAGAASWRYFNRPCRQLSLAQAALLAGLPQRPSALRPDRFPDEAKRRRDHVLARMRASGMIDDDQYTHALTEPVHAAWHPLPQARPGAKDAGSLPALVDLSRRFPGATVRSTIDAPVQRHVAGAARETLDRLQPGGVDAVAVVVMDVGDGEVLASVSLCPASPQIDLTRRPRSTGSVVKPFLYAAAFESGLCDERTLMDDSPAAWSGYVPQNYDRAFGGRMTAARALAESRNIPALQLLARLGAPYAASRLSAAGIRSLAHDPDRYGLSLAIGGAEATPLEMATAYATLARGGANRQARFVRSASVRGDELVDDGRSVEGDDGGARSQKPGASRRGGIAVSPLLASGSWLLAHHRADTAFTADACWRVLRSLSDRDRTAALCPEAAALGAAWKTGTSGGHRDAWCAAVSRRRVVVVWLGNARGEGSRSLVGIDAAAPLALRLLSSLDPHPTLWPEPTRDEPNLARRDERPRLSILSPAPGTEFVRCEDVADDDQRVLLQATLSGPDDPTLRRRKLWWLADGEPIGSTAPDEPLWWAPAPGRHEIHVTDDRGTAASVQILVR